MSTRGSFLLDMSQYLWEASANSSLECLVNSDALCYPENGFLKHLFASVAHLINPLPLQRKGFPLNFSSIHLDLWLTCCTGTGRNHTTNHCLPSDALLSAVNGYENTHRCIWNEISVTLYGRCWVPLCLERDCQLLGSEVCHLVMALILD